MRISQKFIETWNGYVNWAPQEFVTIKRQAGVTDITEMVDQYVEAMPQMFTWTPDELEQFEADRDDIRGDLIAYLERTQGEEWK